MFNVQLNMYLLPLESLSSDTGTPSFSVHALSTLLLEPVHHKVRSVQKSLYTVTEAGLVLGAKRSSWLAWHALVPALVSQLMNVFVELSFLSFSGDKLLKLWIHTVSHQGNTNRLQNGSTNV